jgi:hypothetical protein
MKRIRKIGNKIVYIIGLITTISLIGVILFFIYVRKINPEPTNISYDDGPHIFYLNDSTIKSVVIEGNENHNFTVHEYITNLNDSAGLKQVSAHLPKGFDPLDTFQTHTETQYTARIIAAVSDIHVSFHHLEALLHSNDIIDESSNWSWEDGHLVIVGDVFDKGPYVTECLWLIKKLETQAKRKGGKVHFLLGNHERFVLNGVTEHIGSKYEAISDELVISYDQLYGDDTYLGRWLRTKQIMIKINNNLFTHGGISQKMTETQLSLDEINRYFNIWANSDHLMNYELSTRDHIRLIKSNIGPLEYRGYFDRNIFNRGQSSVLTTQSVSKNLKHFNADHIIVGHTIVKEVKGLFDNKVIAINMEYPKGDILSKESDCQMLLILGANYYSAGLNGEKTLLFSGVNSDIQQ